MPFHILPLHLPTQLLALVDPQLLLGLLAALWTQPLSCRLLSDAHALIVEPLKQYSVSSSSLSSPPSAAPSAWLRWMEDGVGETESSSESSESEAFVLGVARSLAS
ncbi:hypothetical protein AC579_4221 [Pseudocercospora musae]|uniref:Uncharacterized protein n=1 Tax=Pseudocercospora musae TaxID=113226 RepID=A0A139IDE2_9PEZI|nr:hypothetical protein AC579_4221 [Pseudocercospora musae]